MNAYLEIVIGPMFASKTTYMIHKLSRYMAIDKKVIIINSSKDTRNVESVISTHTGNTLPAIKTIKLTDLINNKVYTQSDIVGIDEAQFFEDLCEFVLYSVSINKHVIVTGLDGDFTKNKFGHILDLIPYADEVNKLRALCKCGKDAPFTKRITDSTEQELVGAKESYTAVCRLHSNSKN